MVLVVGIVAAVDLGGIRGVYYSGAAHCAGKTMNRFRAWVSSWATTLRIMIFERDLYRQLTCPLNEDDWDDFGEVPRP